MEKRKKLNIFDSLELMNIDNSCHEFPNHYHETFCISLIFKGIFGENDLMAQEGSIVISHPFEVHKNELVDDLKYNLSTLYISEDVMKYISNSEYISFPEKVIRDRELFDLLRLLTQDISGIDKEQYYNLFYQCIRKLIRKYGQDIPQIPYHHPQLLKEIQQKIQAQLRSKIELEELAKQAGKNKFQFIRWFKKHSGVTPFDYILLKRVVKGKQLIKLGLPLAEIAFETGFYDQSHFTNYFKRYVGMSPLNYKSGCNIFQDFVSN